jgi:hypothetical protein
MGGGEVSPFSLMLFLFVPLDRVPFNSNTFIHEVGQSQHYNDADDRIMLADVDFWNPKSL